MLVNGSGEVSGVRCTRKVSYNEISGSGMEGIQQCCCALVHQWLQERERAADDTVFNDDFKCRLFEKLRDRDFEEWAMPDAPPAFKTA